MRSVKVQTTQNVDIEYEIANIGDRILALLIDYVIILGCFIGFIFLSQFLRFIGMGNIGILSFILFLPIAFYDLLCEVFMDGQSFGKKQLKIKVIKMDGSQPTIGSYLLRWLFRVVDITLTSGGCALVTILAGGKGQRLGDIAAGTTVIKTKSKVDFKDTIFTNITDDYRPAFPQVQDMNDRDIRTVKEVLNTNVEERHSIVRDTLELKTKKILEKKLGIQSDLPPHVFLNIVLKDYNYYKGKL